MEVKKKISLMLVVVLLMQIMLPMLTVVLESNLTLFSRAEEETNTWDISATNQDHVTATFDEETGLLTISGTGKMKNWASASYVPWNNVKEKIKNILINNGVTSIGDYAFDSCASLEQIEIPEGVTRIGKWAFSDCTSLSNITIPEGVTSIGSSAFKKCTSLKQIEIPEGVTSIGGSAFYGCTSLTNINVDENNEKYKSIDGVLFNKAETDLIKYPAGKANSKYTIPEGVTRIGNYAFEECTSLEQIEIPESVTSIGWYVFYNCTGLEQIEIPESVTSIGDNAFRGCTSLTNIEIPEGVTSIGGSAFSGCTSLEQIEIPESVTSIGDYAFSGCTSLKQIEIPDGVTSIGYSAFYGCTSLEQIEIPEGVTSIGYKAFYGCTSLEQIEIPEGVTSIRSEAFYNCKSLKKIKIPEGVTSIENHAFYNCISLEQIEIPESVTSIGEDSFCRCTSLKNINVNENNQNYKSIDGVLFNKDITTIIQYPAGRTDSNYIIPEGVTSIGGYAFYYCTSLKQVEIPEGVTSIGMAAFLGCTSLEQIKIPEGVTNIGKSTFLGCTIITSIEIPEGVTSIESLAFSGCTSLTRIVIPEGVTSIESNVFNRCTNLTIYTNSDYVEEYAKNNNIKYVLDKEEPTITKISGNLDKCTGANETVTLTIEGATDGEGVGLAKKAYSFDNGETWQEENTKTFSENTENIVIKVRDKLGNEYTHEEINITNIRDHEWNEGQITKMATCTEKGEKTYTCTVCGETKVEDIPALGHNYVDGVCTRCGEKEAKIKINSNKYEIGEYITKIAPKTTVEEFKKNIETNATVKVFNKDNKELPNAELVGTGMKAEFTLDDEKITYELVVPGDTSGDGKADFKDIVKMNKHRLSKVKLEGAYEVAGDVTEDGKIDFKDMVKINKFRLGKITKL